MIKKIAILGLIVCSLLISSTISVTAAEQDISDDLDDVLETNAVGETDIVSNKPNVDIKKVSYERNGQTVTLKLTVKGEIENDGSIELYRLIFDEEYYEEKLGEFDGDENALFEYLLGLDTNLTAFIFLLETNDNYYSIVYVNEEILISDDYSVETIPPLSFSVNGATLSISFDLVDSGDRLANLSAAIQKSIDSTTYDDDVYGECIDGSSSSGGSSSNTPGFEMIAVIAAIAISLIILRRKK